VIETERFIELQNRVEQEIYIDKSILDYVSRIVRDTRQHPKIDIGASPRGGLALLKISRAMALLNGRDYVTPDDVKYFTGEALAHRLILNIEETLEGFKPAAIIDEIVAAVPVPVDFQPR